MSNTSNYPSCIKPPISKQSGVTNNGQYPNIDEIIKINDKLIVLANEVFKYRKWNHHVTNQTLDFLELANGKYIAGCTTFFRIQLEDGTFHEDIGYSNAEASTKGLCVQYAKLASVTDAFKKVLKCFDVHIEGGIQQMTNKSTIVKSKKESIEDSQMECDMLAHTAKLDAAKLFDLPNENKESNFIRNNAQEQQSHAQPIMKVEISDNQNELKRSEAAKAELARQERKRKQLEKQMEYKRQMEEREKLMKS